MFILNDKELKIMKRHSLHIGIDHYDDVQIRDLPFCTADAELMASFFRDVAGYESVARLDNPKRGAILDAVSAETSRLKSGDLLVMTYSGHGMRIKDDWVIMAKDSRYELAHAGVDGFPLRLLKDRICNAGVNLALFLDSCPTEDAGTRGISFARPTTECLQKNRDLVIGDSCEGPAFFIMWPDVALEIKASAHGLFSLALDRALRELHAMGPFVISDEIRVRTAEHMKALCRENGNLSSPDVTLTMSPGAKISLW